MNSSTLVHPALDAAAAAASDAARVATMQYHRLDLIDVVELGADGTPTSRLDKLVESAILDVLSTTSINILSEEAGFIDRGSSETIVVDPVDGTGNAASGVPIACFTAAIAYDGVFVEGLTQSLVTGERWWARPGELHGRTSTGTTRLSESVVSTIRPKDNAAEWLSIARGAARVRILGSSSFEAALVCDGRLDAFVDPGSDTHRIVDLAAAIVLAQGTGAVVCDLHGRPFVLGTDVSTRWSGLVAATQELADEIIETVLGASTPHGHDANDGPTDLSGVHTADTMETTA